MRIKRIEMQIELEDGTIVQGMMSAESGDARWGADVPHLAACVSPMQDMNDALSENGWWLEDDAEAEG